LAIFIMPPSVEELEKRLRGRNTETEDKIKLRMARAEFELSLSPRFDEQIINDDLETAIAEAYEKIRSFIG
jgi:guanylate kinase